MCSNAVCGIRSVLHTFSGPSCQFRIRFYAPSFHHGHSAGSNWFWTFLHFNQAHSTIASNGQSFMITEAWNLNTNLCSSLSPSNLCHEKLYTRKKSSSIQHLLATQWCLDQRKHFDHRRKLQFSRALWLVWLPMSLAVQPLSVARLCHLVIWRSICVTF